MAAITSAGTGLYSATGTWVGGVVPVEGDTVTIAAGHTVTVDGTYIIGADATNGLTINGRLKASRTVNSLLTLKTTIANASTGEWDWGIEGDTIPSSVTAGVRINYSGTMANSKYHLYFAPTNRMNLIGFRGATKTRYTTTTTAITGGSTVTVTVADATGWQIGDYIGLSADTNGNTANVEHKAITGISGNDITVGSAWTNSRAAGAYVINCWSNVYIEHYNAANYAALRVQIRSGMPANSIDIADISLHGISGANEIGGLDFLGTYVSPACLRNQGPQRVALSNIRRDGSNHTGYSAMSFNSSSSVPVRFYSCAAFGRGGANAGGFSSTNGGSGATFEEGCAINPTTAFGSFWSQGGQGTSIINCIVRNANAVYNPGPAIGWTDTGGNYQRITRLSAVNSGSMIVSGATIDNVAEADLCTVSQMGVMQFTLRDCTFPAIDPVADTIWTSPGSNGMIVDVINRGGDTTAQERWTNKGKVYRDNSQLLRSRSSIRFEPTVANTALSQTYSVAATSGAATTFRFGLRFDATFGAATPPTVTVSGLGITPQTFTCTATADAWFEQAITVTPTSTGNLTITVSGQSTATTGKFWFSGMTVSPWIDWTFQYGYQYAPTSATLTADANIVAGFATASAYAGLAWSAGTLTVTANRSPQEVYDWAQAYAVANRLDQFVSGGPTALVIAGDLTLDNASITGSGGTISADAYNRVGTGDTDHVVIVAGVRKVKIKAPNLISGTRVQLYNVTDAVEVENLVIGSGGYLLRADYSSDKTYRLRATYQSGTTAKHELEATGVFGSGGLTFLDSQTDESVYNNAGIDGSTCTEFSDDYPNVQIDISDPDGVTTVQRLYAWYHYTITTANGIRNFFKAMEAPDDANFTIDQSIVDLKLDNTSASPVRIEGGYLSRKDGTTVIAAASGSVQMDPLKAYLANAGSIADGVWTHASGKKVVGNTSLIPVLL